MPLCDNCGKERATTTTVTVWTARVAPKTTNPKAPNTRHNLATYNEFMQHRFEVCPRCLNWDRYRGYLTGVILLVMTGGAVLGTMAFGWPRTVAIAVGVGVMAACYFIMSRLGRAWRQNKHVLERRRQLDPKFPHRVFSDAEYKELMKNKRLARR